VELLLFRIKVLTLLWYNKT